MPIGDSVRRLILQARTQGVARSRAEVGGLSHEVTGLKNGWTVAGRAARLAAGAFVAAGAAGTAAAVGAGLALTNTGRQVENYRLRLNTVLRDTEKAQKLFAYLVEFGAKTPFELPGLIEASTRLESFGINTENVLRTIGDAASAWNLDVTTAALAVTQAMSGEMEMLKQFAITSADIERVIGKRINRRTVEGQREVVDAVLKIFEERYAGGMKRAEESLDTILSNIADNFFKFKKRVAEGGFFDTVKQDAADVLAFIDRMADEGQFDAISTGFNNAFVRIHDVFFAPILGDMKDLKVNYAVTAATVERTTLAMAKSLAEGADRIHRVVSEIRFLGGLSVQTFLDPNQFRAMREEWGDMMEGFLTGIDRTENLGDRIAELDRVLEELRKTGGKVTPEIAEILGIDLAEKIGKATEDLGREGVFGGEPIEVPIELKPLFRPLTASDLGLDRTLAPTGGLRFDLGEPQGEGDIPEGLKDELEARTEAWRSHYEFLNEMESFRTENIREMAEYRTDFALQEAALIEAAFRNMFDNLGRYQEVYARKNINLGRATNAFLVRATGEAGKAVINALVAEARVKQAMALADAAAAAASFNFATAAGKVAAAAKYGLITGAAGIASALIDRSVREREERILGEGVASTDFGSRVGGVSGRGISRGSASTVRTGNMVNNFYIAITNNVAGDYKVSEGDLSDAEQIQALIDQGLLQIPN